MMIHDDSKWSGKSSGLFSGKILYHMILISHIFTCNGIVLLSYGAIPHLLGTGMEMQSRELRVLRKAATFKQFFAQGIGSSGHGFTQPEVVLDHNAPKRHLLKAPFKGAPWLELTQPDPNPKEFPSTQKPN